jgi:hypothetical protein
MLKPALQALRRRLTDASAPLLSRRHRTSAETLILFY